MGWLALVLLAALVAGAKSGAPPKPKPKDTGPGADVPPGFTPTGAASLPPLPGVPIAIPTKPTLPPFAALGSGLAAPPPPTLSPTGDWPGVQSLPDPYRTNAMEALQGVSYAGVMNGTAPCSSAPALFTCSSGAIYGVLDDVFKHQKAIATEAGGLGGANVPQALKELTAAFKAVQAVGR